MHDNLNESDNIYSVQFNFSLIRGALREYCF